MAADSKDVFARIEARKAAQSYHIDTNTRVPSRPSINYARGDVIVVTMKEGTTRGVDRVDIRGKVDGIQLEAGSDTTAAPADSAAPRPPATVSQGTGP